MKDGDRYGRLDAALQNLASLRERLATQAETAVFSRIELAEELTLALEELQMARAGLDQEPEEALAARQEELLKNQKLQALSLLAGGIAHDFNNILTTILGNLQVSRMYPRDDSRKDTVLMNAEKACLQARQLTQQLLTFSQGGSPIRELASIAEIIHDTVDFSLSGSKASCRVEIAPDLWPAEVDAGQISQVLSNLLINADQAMPQGGTIKVTAGNVVIEPQSAWPLEPGAYVKVVVQDQGTGIPPSHLPSIFDPYFTTKQRGSGLGLAGAYSIVKNHHGHITVESVVGVGSTFAIYLPSATPGTPAISAPTDELPQGSGRVLVMDDEAGVREFAQLVLTSLGYEVTLAQEGASAVRLYQEAWAAGQPFQVAILDLTVRGGMGGEETLNQLRGIDPEVQAIVCSGYSSDPVMSQYREHGFKACICKPYEVSELAQAVKALTS